MGTRVYIGRLSHHARERDVERFFKGYGRLRDVMLKNGYGFVEFEDYRDADDAVYELNGKDLAGERVIVEHARGGPRGDDRRSGYRDFPPPRRSRGGGGRDKVGDRRRMAGNLGYGPPTRTEYRLIVENLSSRVSWQDLKDYMRQAGEVTYADAHKEHKNEGVVEFSSYSDMKNAMNKLDGTEINGRKIKLIEDKPKRSRRRSPSTDSDASSTISETDSDLTIESNDRSSYLSSSDDRMDDSDVDSDASSMISERSYVSRWRSRSYHRYWDSFDVFSSNSRSPSRSRSRSRSRRRSRSASRSRSRSRSRSSRSKSKSKSPDRKSRSKSPSKSRSRSKSPSKSRSRSKSRSKSPGDKDDKDDN